ncbi:S-layer homology domain-containing protein [Cohnella faecalis]|uniref:S-layer homology domain-containing protein n=1 Tax=Cohnella faecalis TaxID=2315694 RepID=UPI003988F05C
MSLHCSSRDSGLQDEQGASAFRDVKEPSWYAKDVSIATGKGLLTGDPGGSFRPNAPLTRQELAVIIANALRYAKPQEKLAEASLASFTDAYRVPDGPRERCEPLLPRAF